MQQRGTACRYPLRPKYSLQARRVARVRALAGQHVGRRMPVPFGTSRALALYRTYYTSLSLALHTRSHAIDALCMSCDTCLLAIHVMYTIQYT